MPNWCECDLTIEGTAQSLKRFLDYCGNKFEFGRFIPYPEEFAALDEAARRWEQSHREDPENCGPRPKDGFNQGGYEWCVENWGTKWDACEVEMPELPPDSDGDSPNPLEIEIRFETAWSPPLMVILAASKQFPELAFDLRYFEGGQGYNGWLRCEAGEVVVEESGDYFGSRGG
jgi:hypothetical protein